MAKSSERFPSKYLKGSDIEGMPTFTISSVVPEEVGSEREQKYVVYFRGQQKGVVLNKTNNDTLEALYGEDDAGWIGEPITLFSTPVTYQGRTTDAIRFRAPKKSVAKQKAEIENSLDDEIPFN